MSLKAFIEWFQLVIEMNVNIYQRLTYMSVIDQWVFHFSFYSVGYWPIIKYWEEKKEKKQDIVSRESWPKLLIWILFEDKVQFC